MSDSIGMEKLAIVYIAGYGRSGSTVLDAMLGHLVDGVSAGELGQLPFVLERVRMGCSCGNQYANCEVWSSSDAICRSMSRMRRLFLSLSVESVFGVPRLSRLLGYCSLWERVLDERLGGAKCRLLVDSSKTAYRFARRAEALSLCENVSVYVVHVVRPLSDVLSSRAKGSNFGLFKGKTAWSSMLFWRTRTIIGWAIANLMARRLAKVSTISGYTRVEFAMLRSDLEGVSRNVLRQLSLPERGEVIPDEASGATIPVGHMVEANRVARTPIQIR